LTPPNGVHVRVEAAFGSLADEWDALVAASPLPSPFLRSWWLSAVAGGTPRLVLVFDGGHLVGGLPLESDRWMGVERLRFLGSGPLCPDHLDLVAAAGFETEVTRAVGAWLGGRGSRILDLDGVAEGTAVRAALPDGVRPVVFDLAPWLALDSDSQLFMALRPGRLRNALTRARRRLAPLGVEHRVMAAGAVDEHAPALKRLASLHEQRWGPRSRFLHVFDRFEAASREGLARGELVYHELLVGGEPVACQVWFEVANRASYYQGGRRTDHDLRGVGNLLMAAALERAFALGFAEADLLRGDEAYKHEWADRTRPVVSIRTGWGPAGSVGASLMTASRALTGTVGRLAGRDRADDLRTAGANGRV
jgi:CelD/BcsL family acetyltransferase involved in cellulose biosynthesis